MYLRVSGFFLLLGRQLSPLSASRVESSLSHCNKLSRRTLLARLCCAEGREACALLSAHGGSSVLGECWSQQNVFPAGVITVLETVEEPAPGPVELCECQRLTSWQSSGFQEGRGGEHTLDREALHLKAPKDVRAWLSFGGPGPESQVDLLLQFPDTHCLRDQASLGYHPVVLIFCQTAPHTHTRRQVGLPGLLLSSSQPGPYSCVVPAPCRSHHPTRLHASQGQ